MYKFSRCETVQVFHHAVVVDDGQLAVGEANCHEIVILLRTRMVWIVLHLLGAHQGSSCRAVMAVGDVHGRHGSKNLRNALDILFVLYEPEVVTHAVDRHKIIFRQLCRRFGYNLVEFPVIGIRKEDRLYVGVVHPHVFHAVLLLVAPSEFMFFNFAGHVVLHRGTHHQSVLCLAIHGLGVYVIHLLLILEQPSLLLEQVEVFGRLCIHILVVFIFSHREVDLRLDDVIK